MAMESREIIARILLNVGPTRRGLSEPELDAVAAQVALVGFPPVQNMEAGGTIAGMLWGGRVIKGTDRLAPADRHYLKHVLALEEWPAGTTLEAWLAGLRDVILDRRTGILLSRFDGRLQLAFFRKANELRGPGGNEWLMVEYAVELGYVLTAFQPAAGLGHVEGDPRRSDVQWLRRPT